MEPLPRQRVDAPRKDGDEKRKTTRRNRASQERLTVRTKGFSDEQKKSAGDMGMQSLMNVLCPNLVNPLCDWLGNIYDPESREFVIPGHGRLPLDEESVFCTLGVPRGELVVPYETNNDIEQELFPRLFPNEASMPNRTVLADSLEKMKTHGDVFKMKLLMYLISSVFAPTTSLRPSNKCFPILARIADVKNMNWCKFIADFLHDALANKMYQKGCRLHLMLMYVNRLDLSTIDLDAVGGLPPPHKFAVSAWTSEAVKAVLATDRITNTTYGKLQELTHLHSPVPNGEQHVEAEGSVDASEDEEVAEDPEDDAADQDYHEDEEEEPESPMRKERRSKLQEDPELGPTRTAASSARPPKRDRAETPESAERVARPAAKLRKALPRMKIPVPVASMAATSVTSPPLGVDDAMEDDTADAATSHRETIDVEDDEETPRSITPPTSSIAPSPVLGMPPSTSAVTMPPPSAPPTITAPIVAPSVVPSTEPTLIVPTPRASTPPNTRTMTIMCPLYRVPEDQVGAAKEAMIQSKLMMERTKQAYEASRLAYDASSSLEANIRKACEISSHYAELEQEKTNLSIDLEATKSLLLKTQNELKTLGEVRDENRRLHERVKNCVSIETVKKALEDKDAELAAAQKMAKEKTEEATRKLAGMEQLEKELDELKKEKSKWGDKYNNLKERKTQLEQLFERETGKFFAMLDEFCQNFEEETDSLEPKLDPTKSLTGDAAMMNTYRLESRLESVQKYISRLKDAIKGIDEVPWAEDTKLYDLDRSL